MLGPHESQLPLQSRASRYEGRDTSGITRDLKQHAEQNQATPAPKITDSQYAVLARLSAGGGTRYVISRYGVLKAIDKDRATVNVSTHNALIKRGLASALTSPPKASVPSPSTSPPRPPPEQWP
ncbi:hypothetical protein [Streptomyces sp. ATCC 21386]|uniref:hypothetical protein n=1 Tax=Streptomyces sp. ATCC 21386 TaxID=2699428 RepID=UPI001BFFCB04|nr:hypothetical protein [Streptomyces sp. ATCC 21386]